MSEHIEDRNAELDIALVHLERAMQCETRHFQATCDDDATYEEGYRQGMHMLIHAGIKFWKESS